MSNHDQVKAITITPQVQQWLGKPTAVSLLHIFDQVINLIDSDGEIISVVQPQIGAGPFALVLAEERPFPCYIAPYDPIHKINTSLYIGQLQIDLRTAKVWQPCPRWRRCWSC